MYLQGESNYNKFPTTGIEGYDRQAFAGYGEIAEQIKAKFAAGKRVVTVDCNTAVDIPGLERKLCGVIPFDRVIHSADIFESNEEIERKLAHHVTDDRVYGVLYHGTWEDFIDKAKLEAAQKQVCQTAGTVLVIGTGASYITPGDALLFADMTIWETQMRYRKQRLCNFGTHNPDEDFIRKYKRGFFIDWRLNNRNAQRLFDSFTYYLDTVDTQSPTMLTREAFNGGIAQVVSQPFRTMPFFDEGLWGGKWLREVCDVHDDTLQNIAWGYNLLFQENEVNLTFGNTKVNVSGYTLSLKAPKELIGEKGFARFGAEYPIRYDFLDTMDGGNLSLQVHPNQQYMQERFGMAYTQDESYYYLDCVEGDCHIYLGTKDGVERDEMIHALQAAQNGQQGFDDAKYINKIPVKKHQHYHIPAGTVHASGRNGMVLEISTSPCIFTFKLWDWGRVGMDGLPRPIHIEHGSQNIAWERTTDWVMQECAYPPIPLRGGDCYREEKIGLQQYQPIETHRVWFSGKYYEATGGETQALNLVEGREAIIESPTNAFKPYVIHFAESIVIPAGVSEYTVRPHGESEGKELAIVKTFARV